MQDLEDFFSNIAVKITPEYLEQLDKNEYSNDREYPENFSNWYTHIKDFGKFKHTDIINNQIFTFEETQIMRKTEIMKKVNWEEINEILKPTISKMEAGKLYNIKNGCFSNKFDFQTCITDKENLAKKLWEINYYSTMFGTGGFTELVIREIIPNTVQTKHPTIYNGMPLREEIRVFYNMDTKQIEYMVDYWDYNYCYEGMHNKTDKIKFDWFHNKIAGREINHIDKVAEIQNKIRDYIPTLKFDNYLTGIWSIDFLNEGDDIYLIDMARGFRSAYWDEQKIKTRENEKKEV